MQKPNTETLQLLKVIASFVLENKIKDAWILPVTINYEKVLEG
jgi:glycerol-3-phosphate O-acyltransferase